jgi:hypothetical protein
VTSRRTGAAAGIAALLAVLSVLLAKTRDTSSASYHLLIDEVRLAGQLDARLDQREHLRAQAHGAPADGTSMQDRASSKPAQPARQVRMAPTWQPTPLGDNPGTVAWEGLVPVQIPGAPALPDDLVSYFARAGEPPRRPGI